MDSQPKKLPKEAIGFLIVGIFLSSIACIHIWSNLSKINGKLNLEWWNIDMEHN